MYKSTVSILIAFVTAALFAALTEPQSTRQSQASRSGLSVIQRTASKGDRLTLHPAPICSPNPAASNGARDGARRDRAPRLRLSERIVLVRAED